MIKIADKPHYILDIVVPGFRSTDRGRQAARRELAKKIKEANCLKAYIAMYPTRQMAVEIGERITKATGIELEVHEVFAMYL